MSTARRPTVTAHSQASATPAFDAWSIALGIFAFSNLANGAWMLVDPVHWYHHLPAGVPDFGPLNEHFVRDIGCIFFILGVALAVGAYSQRWRVAACALNAAFYLMHALVHVLDTMRGLVGPEHWRIDLSGVYAPAVIMIAVTFVLARRTT